MVHLGGYVFLFKKNYKKKKQKGQISIKEKKYIYIYRPNFFSFKIRKMSYLDQSGNKN